MIGLFSCKEVAQKPREIQEVQAPPPPATVLGAPEVRVAVVRDAQEVRIAATDGALVVKNGTGSVLAQIADRNEAVLRLSPSGLTLDGRSLGLLRSMRITKTAEAGRVSLDGVELGEKADLFIDPARNNTLSAVAYVGIEEYLVGVLAGEVPYDRWGAEALKAQAITSRTYALYQMKIHANEACDVESTVMSQVFKPGNRNNVVLNRAVNGTRGLVLTSGGRIFPAYFHSTCGGATARGTSVFADSPAVGTLNGVACPFCAQSPSYRWHAELTRDEIGRRLRAFPDLAGQTIGTIQGLDFLGGSAASPRAESVRVRHSGGVLTMSANRFRIAVGPGVLKSVLLERVTATPTGFAFDGRGFGHGVGLCQYGSNGMAEKGYTCEQILGFYYPGGELTKVYGERITASR
ncbi:MAG: SpoIID/LytB domain-containing protein [Planctomycetes bacterium]|nr:SpoIID/LytB domain-containing protein [Planctomycetota bacterium]